MADISVDPQIYEQLLGLYRQPRPFDLHATSGTYGVALIHALDDPSDFAHEHEAEVKVKCRNGQIHQIGICYVREIKIRKTDLSTGPAAS